MWWSMPETEARAPGSGTRRLALAGTIERQQRTVLTSLALADVQPNPDQPRKHFAPEKLAELADSIKTRGLLQPIIVRRGRAATSFWQASGASGPRSSR